MNKTQKAMLAAVIAIVVGLMLLLVSVLAAGGPIRIISRVWDHFQEQPAATGYVTEGAAGEATEAAAGEVFTLHSGDRLQFAEFTAVEISGLICDVELGAAPAGQYSLSLQGLSVEPAPSGQYLLIYQGGQEEKITVELAGGVLRIDGGSLPQANDISSLRSLIRGQRRQLTLLLPEDWGGRLSVQGAVGDVDIRQCAFSQLELGLTAGDLKMSSVGCAGPARVEMKAGDMEIGSFSGGELDIFLGAGDLDMAGVSCTGPTRVEMKAGDLDMTDMIWSDLELILNLGDLDMTNVDCGALKVSMDAGDLDFQGLYPTSADIYCRLGEVSGSLRGSQADYSTDCRVRLGESLGTASGGGSRQVKISVDMGHVELSYRQ